MATPDDGHASFKNRSHRGKEKHRSGIGGHHHDKERECSSSRRRHHHRDEERSSSHHHRAREEKEKHREERDREKKPEGPKRRDPDRFTDDEEDGDRKRQREERAREKDVETSKRRAPDRTADEEEDGDRRWRRRSHREPSEEAPNKREDEDEGDVAANQRRVDEEMERRRRRVKKWQENRREQESKQEGEPKAGKYWTLDGEESDSEGEKHSSAGEAVNGAGEKEEIDPLDAFMNSMVLPEVANLETGRTIPGKESDSDSDSELDDKEDLEKDEVGLECSATKKSKAEKLALVDHSKIDYHPFRKSLYIEAKEISAMTAADVAAHRKQLELKVHGKDVPKPIKTWTQSGLATKLLDALKKLGFAAPMPIQAQALPIIMSGRDCIGVAKTGSGKTLAFVLPMLRHVKDQPPLEPGDGPIALVMAPTRELVVQIHAHVKKLAKPLSVRCVAAYGGSGVAQQIADLKRGAEVVVCTPGRMIDMLTSSGKVTNLRRVTFLVMDEADRMFDMGFEPQITRIVQNTRPDRQTVLFSATFPRPVEILGRRVLSRPVEIQVGGKNVANRDVAQLVEVRPESERLPRLLELLLGEWLDAGKVLVFVHSQDKCDCLVGDLFRHGHRCLSLHGGKSQADRESTMAAFKGSGGCRLLIATSVAARGLDVPDLGLVVNYDVPNHYEDYVHRVGRTGRAGRKGCAVTFISDEEVQYAPDLVKALELAEQAVPADLKAMAERFAAKLKQGKEHGHASGYGGSGFKFDEEEEEACKSARKAQARKYGYEEDKSESDSDEESARNPPPLPAATAAAATVADPAAARALEAAASVRATLARILGQAAPEHHEAELEINDLPQSARWRITHKDTLGPISEWTGAAITTRGAYIPPAGRIGGPNERKLHLFIEGHSESSVKKAKAELVRVLRDCECSSLPGSSQPYLLSSPKRSS